MYIHIFAFHWHADVTAEQKKRAADGIRALQGQIPGLLETHVGCNTSPRGRNYTFGGVMKFDNQSSLEAYGTHPAHQALLQWLLPLVDPVEIDFPA